MGFGARLHAGSHAGDQDNRRERDKTVFREAGPLQDDAIIA
jgi:hypothetical protein